MERGLAWTATREPPMVITHDGPTFRAWAESGGVASVSADQQARPSNAHWSVAFEDGRIFGGPEAHPDDADEDVQRIVADVWREHGDDAR